MSSTPQTPDQKDPVASQAAVQAQHWFEQGLALHKAGQFERAAALYGQALNSQPDHSDALNFLGVLFHQTGDHQRAIDLIGEAIRIDGGNGAYYSNRGLALMELKQVDAALAHFEQAISLNPGSAVAHYNRGNALLALGRLDCAVASYDEALRQVPGYADAYVNRGNALAALGQVDAAIACWDRATAIRPDLAQAHWNKALALLRKGHYREGWRLYEWRWQWKDFPSRRREFTQPPWRGAEPLAGKTILLHSEQGLGDTLQFCRYARMVSGLGAHVILEVEKPLVTLLQSLDGVSRVGETGSTASGFDYQCPLLSLPMAFGTELDTIPAAPAYLKASAARLAYWARTLGGPKKPRVGLIWRGNVHYDDDRGRSVALRDFLPLLSADFEFVSLQKEVRDADEEVLRALPELRHFGSALGDFADTAALCELMDLVISVDTSVAHLAGALGKTVWILLPLIADWRWLSDRVDSPWYPSATLYRQARKAEWGDVIDRIRDDLALHR